MERIVSELPFSPSQPWLAPLAGWSDLSFRLLCREHGAAVCCTEMISSKGLVYGGPGTEDLLAVTPEDSPLVAQLFGSEASFMAEAASRLLERGFQWIDCNMGCSVPKVTRTGAGAALCRDTDNALRVAEAMIRVAGRGRVGFKLRLGWNGSSSDGEAAGQETWRMLGPALAELGAGWLTLHPRTAKQGFTGTARWGAIAELKKLVSVPVIASGDLLTAEDGVRCLAETGADTVMYARGALRDPAIFTAHTLLLQGKTPPPPDAATLFARIRRHATLASTLTPPRAALLKMRTIVPRYARHLEHASLLRLAVIACKSWEDFEDVLRRFEAEHGVCPLDSPEKSPYPPDA